MHDIKEAFVVLFFGKQEVSAPGARVKKQQQQDRHLLNPSFGGVTPDPAPEKVRQNLSPNE